MVKNHHSIIITNLDKHKIEYFRTINGDQQSLERHTYSISLNLIDTILTLDLLNQEMHRTLQFLPKMDFTEDFFYSDETLIYGSASIAQEKITLINKNTPPNKQNHPRLENITEFYFYPNQQLAQKGHEIIKYEKGINVDELPQYGLTLDTTDLPPTIIPQSKGKIIQIFP